MCWVVGPREPASGAKDGGRCGAEEPWKRRRSSSSWAVHAARVSGGGGGSGATRRSRRRADTPVRRSSVTLGHLRVRRAAPCLPPGVAQRNPPPATHPNSRLRASCCVGRLCASCPDGDWSPGSAAEHLPDELARRLLHLGEVLRPAERLRVDLVNVLGPGGPGGEP